MRCACAYVYTAQAYKRLLIRDVMARAVRLDALRPSPRPLPAAAPRSCPFALRLHRRRAVRTPLARKHVQLRRHRAQGVARVPHRRGQLSCPGSAQPARCKG
ncbi:hypothetical protein FGB62_2g030 [Gracilaria domingensis]|nr:hypothetical protein FGB62_2g030 [Gracilaria domingensis]